MGLVSGEDSEAEITAWLKAGGLAVAASERAARALTAAYDSARREQGLSAWPSANIQDWRSFVSSAWAERGGDDRMVMSSFQEQALWAEISGAEGRGTALLEGPRRQMAALAMDAHSLLSAYAPKYLNRNARSAWQADAAAFSGWLSGFEQTCSSQGLLSEARLPLELLPLLEADTEPRPPLLLAGFDRILPIQKRLLDAWGSWREAAQVTAGQVAFYTASDETAELTACARWCKLQLDANPGARLLVVTQDVASRRGEIERAFLRFVPGQGAAPLFEFSLGVPLRQVALPRGAHLLLRWLSGPIEENELDWFFSTGQIAADAAEERALAGFMRALRRGGMERTRWRLEEFIGQRPGAVLPDAWIARMLEARRRLDDLARRPAAGALSWAEQVPQLLEAAGWPGGRALTSAEFQAMRRWRQTLDACASLSFNGQRMSWNEFLSVLAHCMDETLFAPESRQAPIQIAGPAESAGLTADAIWMMGASEDKWPAGGSTNPLLPFDLQRDAKMPHGTPQLDWDLAQAMTNRLASSAPVVCFSYARQTDGAAVRPSRLITTVAGVPLAMPAELAATVAPLPQTETYEDASRVRLTSAHTTGGSTILSSQSQCPIKAFATGRLNALGWEPAQAGLSASQRGQLLHSVLHSVWAGKPEGIRTQKELLAIADLTKFVEGHVDRALRSRMFLAACERMPKRYMQLEAIRLVRLVTEWLEFERSRVDFAVARTELDTDADVAGLSLKLRMDRIDRLCDGTLLVIDYKSGNVSTSSWELPRPDDVQLPLYAGFGLAESLRDKIAQEFQDAAEAGGEAAGRVGGLVFAKVKPGEVCFAGRVGDAATTLLPGINNRNALVQKPFNAEEFIAWIEHIETMARNFIAGRAEVDPREYPKTCEWCDLQSLCRIQEMRTKDEEAEDE